MEVFSRKNNFYTVFCKSYGETYLSNSVPLFSGLLKIIFLTIVNYENLKVINNVVTICR